MEIEHVDVETLEALAAEGVDVEPKPSTIRIIQVQPAFICSPKEASVCRVC